MLRVDVLGEPKGLAWDGVIHCQVLEAIRDERLVYGRKGGHEGNVGYGLRLDTVITWILSGWVSATEDSW